MAMALAKPKYWCKEWYIEQKKLGHSDHAIADMMFIHINTFNRWKKQLDLPKFAYTFSPARGSK